MSDALIVSKIITKAIKENLTKIIQRIQQIFILQKMKLKYLILAYNTVF